MLINRVGFIEGVAKTTLQLPVLIGSRSLAAIKQVNGATSGKLLCPEPSVALKSHIGSVSAHQLVVRLLS